MSPQTLQGQPHKILVVDDTTTNLRILTNLLIEQGYTVHPASDGELALEFVGLTLPDLILLDIRMPGMDGFEICRRLKEDERTRSIPVIFISILENAQDIVKAFQAGAVDYITKPIRHEEVTTRVRTHLQLRDLAVNLEEKVRERTKDLMFAQKQLEQELVERKKVETALRVSEEKYRRIVDTASEGIWVVGPDLMTTFVNSSMAGMMGYDAEEMIGRPLADFMFEEDWPDHFQKMENRKQGLVEHYERRFSHKDGHLLWTLASATPIFDGSRFNGTFGMFADITERKKLEEQLRQSQKMEAIGQLAGGVAHDFNNMLTVIINSAEIALLKMEETDPLRNTLLQIIKAGQHSAEITRQLLAFARKQVIKPKILNLNDTIEGMLKLMRRLIGEDIDLVWLPCKNIWPVKMDPSQIDQVLANLCINAKDAVTGDGKLTIETQNISVADDSYKERYSVRPDNYVMLVVSDNGVGMDKQTQDKIFEPFFSTKEAEKGTGLGLATVYGIVKQNNGFINVYSEPGYGSTFKIYLPRHAGKAEKTRKAIQAVPLSRGSETILVVEDEPAVMNIVKQLLEDCRYRVLTASGPDEALHIGSEHYDKINLLLTDVVLPGMTGWELAQKMKTLSSTLKYLFMSGYTGNVIVHQSILDEGVNFIQKPFSTNALAIKVRQVLDDKV